jgi:probable rRNA maturation factor
VSPDGPTSDEVPEGIDVGDLPVLPRGRRKHAAPADGDLEVYGVDEQDDEPVDVARWVALAHDVLRAEGVGGDAELSITFVDEATMADLNRRFMGADGPTDVLAFPIDEPIEGGRNPDAGDTGPDREPPPTADLPLLLGDVVICPAVAARQAPEHAGSYDDEIALLVVHGVLHVLGHDHAEPEETAVMQARERDHLERFHHR